MSEFKPYPSWDRLSEAWMVLYDLSLLPDKQISQEDKLTLDAARHVVNLVQVRVFEAGKRAASAVTPAAPDAKEAPTQNAD